MVATMAVDLDHLLAAPVFDPNRCSIGFHPLHTWPAMALYLLQWPSVPKTRLVGLGLVIHMVLDGIDCLWMGGAAAGEPVLGIGSQFTVCSMNYAKSKVLIP
jgi:hypothetical protein